MIDQLAAYGDLTPGSRVLEIAPGTGQATRSLAERSVSVTAVEPGEHLAATARGLLAGHDVDVVASAFEDWRLPARPFDAAVCATAWHWLDPPSACPRSSRRCAPAARTVAILRTHHVAGGTTDFFARAQDCYRRWDPRASDEVVLPAEGDLTPSTGELTGSLLVTDVESHLYPVELTYGTDEYLDLLRTYSPVIALSPAQRDGLLGCLRHLAGEAGGQVTKRYAFELVLARSTA